ncbi:MAG: imidazolonepropionase [Parabacteroides sp.]|nr:imidazolonepropionase [Parabacteroides sp.]
MKEDRILIRDAAQIVTCSGFKAKKGAEMSELSVINDGAVAIDKGIIKAVGKTCDVLKIIDIDDYHEISAKGQALIPGFVDSHTHFLFGGYREEEFSWRLKGDSYMSIMKQGGGIINTTTDTRNMSYNDMYAKGYEQLNGMIKLGVTTVEGKSGYGLDLDTELMQLRVMNELSNDHPIDIVSTYLGAHAVPPEFSGRADDYIFFMIEKVMPQIRKERLATFCDVFCEKGVFTIEQSEHLLKAARNLRFKLKLHADEIVEFGGAELAVRVKATSADHLLHASDEGIKKLAKSGTVATLLPLTAFSLHDTYAPGRKMIDQGCAVALASDFNPGSCFSYSVPLMFALACIEMKFSPEEALTALTINGAAALGKASEIGSIDVGKKADILMLKYPSYKFIPYHIGMNCVDVVIKDGVPIIV